MGAQGGRKWRCGKENGYYLPFCNSEGPVIGETITMRLEKTPLLSQGDRSNPPDGKRLKTCTRAKSTPQVVSACKLRGGGQFKMVQSRHHGFLSANNSSVASGKESHIRHNGAVVQFPNSAKPTPRLLLRSAATIMYNPTLSSALWQRPEAPRGMR